MSSQVKCQVKYSSGDRLHSPGKCLVKCAIDCLVGSHTMYNLNQSPVSKTHPDVIAPFESMRKDGLFGKDWNLYSVAVDYAM